MMSIPFITVTILSLHFSPEPVVCIISRDLPCGCVLHIYFKGVVDKIVQQIWPWWVLKYFLADQMHAKINDL